MPICPVLEFDYHYTIQLSHPCDIITLAAAHQTEIQRIQ